MLKEISINEAEITHSKIRSIIGKYRKNQQTE